MCRFFGVANIDVRAISSTNNNVYRRLCHIRPTLRPTLMYTKNLYENGPNPFFSGFFNLMGTRMVQIRMAKSV